MHQSIFNETDKPSNLNYIHSRQNGAAIASKLINNEKIENKIKKNEPGF